MCYFRSHINHVGTKESVYLSYFSMLPTSSLSDRFKTLPQYLIPHHLLSRFVHHLTQLQLGFLTHWIIRLFIKVYGVDMQLAQNVDPKNYLSFNHFFTRALTPEARPLAKATLLSPVDGEISQLGIIENQSLLQAKGHAFKLTNLLAGEEQLAALFNDGLFCTIYLSPRDYHRIHMPMSGQLTKMIYVPGKLFSVNQRTSRVVPNLFARNERSICLFETDLGPMAVILVGALFVGSTETVWTGTLPYARNIRHWEYETPISLQQGEEMGRFNMGSTVILLLNPAQKAWLDNLQPQTKVIMGQALI